MRAPAIGLAALLASSVPHVSRAQSACPEGWLDAQGASDAVSAAVAARRASVAEELTTLASAEAATEPNVRAAKQLQAPSTMPAGAGLVDSPTLGGLLGLALDAGLPQTTDQSAVTLTLTPFALLAASRPEVIDRQDEYRRHTLLRRIEGALTLGGKGESFDRDGDGKPEPAETARNLGDSIGWEARFRLFGSRDRRETSYAQRLEERALDEIVGDVKGQQAVLRKIQQPEYGYDGHGCWSRGVLLTELNGEAIAPELSAQVLRSESVSKAVDAILRDIDRSLVISAFASGVRRDASLGPDWHTFGVRMAVGHGLLDHTLNVDWRREGRSEQGQRPESVKVGYEARGEISVLGLDKALLSLAGAWERYNNVTSAAHRTVFTMGGKVDVALGRGVRMPISVTWANHADLLTGADDVVGNIGISFDLLDQATRPSPPETR